MCNSTQLERVTELLGTDIFFVPCHWGTKRPKVTYVDRTFGSTKSSEYINLFNGEPTNIAVYLGKSSAGLCSIDFDNDPDLEAFLKLNPKLAMTTRSRGSRGGAVWLRIQGDYPESCSPPDKHFEWRADRRLSTISGRHPHGMNYQLICGEPPIVLPFDEICWPESWELPWNSATDPGLEQHYGEPYFLKPDGGVSAINESYWAGLYVAENEILYEPDEKTFYEYNANTGLFQVESVDSIRTKISSRILEASRQMNVFDLQKKRTASSLNNIIAHLRGIAEERGAFNDRKTCIHLANGVVVFDGSRADLHPFALEYRSRNRSPIAFDKNATCRRFMNELVLPAVDPENVELLQKFAGMYLLGNNLAQRILILDGAPGRGKTQFANVMQGLVGMPNVTQLRTKHLSERFELYRYRNKTLLVGVDVESDFLSTRGAAVLKGLVGGDWFDAEQKGGTGCFQFQGIFNVLITSNTRLRVRLQGDVGAWKRRLNIVRYEAPAPKRKIPDFGAYLIKTEGSGILNWALLGAQMVMNEIPDDGGDFHLTQRQRDIVDSLLAESESLQHFLRECVIQDSRHDLTVEELIKSYAAYCPEKKWRPIPITEVQSKMEGLMLELFGVTKRHDIKREGKTQRGFSRVKFR